MQLDQLNGATSSRCSAARPAFRQGLQEAGYIEGHALGSSGDFLTPSSQDREPRGHQAAVPLLQ
jgi:hypothetical protein